MKLFLALPILVVTSLSSTAYAINCQRASSDVEHLICSNPAIVRADADMNRAYAAILKAAPDAEIHDMLVASQKRWIAAREAAFGDLDRATNGQTGETYPKDMQRKMVLKAIRGRTDQLKRRSDHEPGQFHFIQAALDQRRYASQFPRGDFTGFATECFFYPRNQNGSGDNYGYACLGTIQYQNKERICSETSEWATYRVYTTRTVATLVAGVPKIVASCKDETCSGQGGDTASGAQAEAAGGGIVLDPPLPKLDAEVSGSPADDHDSWINPCLTDKKFSLM
ncbi:lysozyme inhibitor LprI family protein [Herbaspirillum huttiense]|uniref:Lysozyme inhibitor LprI family protein n=1 Tax=Herbaspirillum huttiense subsp. lycopersici TaxID=3074428 RepID=A0ABU2ESY4_9BURK|nr:lysozyme inhibitor LprI family protein [Herbaspirillum huttiense]MDR9850868.1 lysozyme inhibitor LprI family protein [Herbaspirillum huttiense SE1]